MGGAEPEIHYHESLYFMHQSPHKGAPVMIIIVLTVAFNKIFLLI